MLQVVQINLIGSHHGGARVSCRYASARRQCLLPFHLFRCMLHGAAFHNRFALHLTCHAKPKNYAAAAAPSKLALRTPSSLLPSPLMTWIIIIIITRTWQRTKAHLSRHAHLHGQARQCVCVRRSGSWAPFPALTSPPPMPARHLKCV